MTTLYIAEKPAQANDIGSVLGIARRQNGFLELKNGDRITWAVGHLLRLAEPDELNEAWGGRWRWEQLPMIPDTWLYKPEKRTSAQLKVIKTLLKDASRVVIATDAGREGELIAREILTYCKYKGRVERFWTSTLTPDDIRKALHALKPGSETEPLYEAALARQHADFMHGLSGTRAVTLAAGDGQLYTLGRVQTPTLALVVKRHTAIAMFESKTYYELVAKVTTKSGKVITMTHAPDQEHRILSRASAEALAGKVQGFTGPLKVVKEKGKEAPPLPYSLPALQKDADRVLGLSAKNTLKVAQALYEKKIISYPRTDCRHLAASQKPEISGILDSVAKLFSAEVGKLRGMGVVLRDSTFDDSKLSDHHGIVPTTLSGHLEGVELQLYSLVALRFIETLAPDCLFETTKVTLDANGVLFKASGKIIGSAGWKEIRSKT